MTTGAPEAMTPAGYRYLRHLGAGGFGDVHLAEHVGTGRRVAIKYIQRHLLADPEVVARFRREAQILAATDVPTVVRVYDLDTSGDPAHLVMEFVPGVTLWDLMEQAPLPAHQGLSVMRDVAEALRVMAERGLVHRDIKPSNVFVLPDGRAKLGDFGLARAVADDGGFRTAGAPAGTPAYFPPEVSSGDAEATVESDAYSFAVMVYEVLTGSRPITAPDAISLITAHWTQPPRPVTEAMPGFPQSVAPVLMRALAKAPAGRPLPHELMAALDAVPADEWPTNDRPPVPVPDAPPLEQAYEQVAATPTAGRPAETTVVAETAAPPPERPAAPVTVRATEVAEQPAAPAPAREPSTGRRRWGPAVVGAALVVLVCGVLAAVWLLRDGGGDPDDGEAAPTGTPELRVTSVALTADPPVVRCPRGDVALVATIATNGGAGPLTVSWTLPDGSSGPEQAFAVEAEQAEVVATLDATLTGSNPVDGVAAVVVRPSGLRASAPVSYRCAR
jgi:hypothetical protein